MKNNIENSEFVKTVSLSRFSNSPGDPGSNLWSNKCRFGDISLQTHNYLLWTRLSICQLWWQYLPYPYRSYKAC